MKPNREIEIVGGGLAGLSLGTALARRDVPVALHEAGAYPRHRVCGEFIRGLDGGTIECLELAPVLAGANRSSEVRWFEGNQPSHRHRLESPAWILSRHQLDDRLADTFVRAGGKLHVHSRLDPTPAAGRVIAAGRARATRSPWLGIKAHARLRVPCDALEMHLAAGAYVGVAPLDGTRVNICGLFRSPPRAARDQLLWRSLEAVGLHDLATRLREGEVDPASTTAVAALPLRPQIAREGLRVGDAYAMIPPFTGNGMAMAWQSAALALAPLLAWARHEATWSAVEREVRRRLRARFGVRLRLAGWLHAPLLSRRAQHWIAASARCGALPVHSLQRALS